MSAAGETIVGPDGLRYPYPPLVGEVYTRAWVGRTMVFRFENPRSDARWVYRGEFLPSKREQWSKEH